MKAVSPRFTRILLSGVSLLLTTVVSAQLKGFGVGPYLEYGNPGGRGGSLYRAGYGAGLSAVVKLPARLAITGSAGYLRLSPDRDGATDPQGTGQVKPVNAFPLRAGLRFRPIPLFFVKAEAGTVHFTGKGSSAFLFAPGIGVRLAGLELIASRETWYRDQHLRFWAFRAGISF